MSLRISILRRAEMLGLVLLAGADVVSGDLRQPGAIHDRRGTALHLNGGSDEIQALVAQLDSNKPNRRLIATNALAGKEPRNLYKPQQVIEAVLLRLQQPISEQAEINCLDILWWRRGSIWSVADRTQTEVVLRRIGSKPLSSREQPYFEKLKNTLPQVRVESSHNVGDRRSAGEQRVPPPPISSAPSPSTPNSGPERVSSLHVTIFTSNDLFSGTDNVVYVDLGPVAFSVREGFSRGSVRTIDFSPWIPNGLSVDDITEVRLEKKGIGGFTNAPDSVVSGGSPLLPVLGAAPPLSHLAGLVDLRIGPINFGRPSLSNPIPISIPSLPKPPIPLPIPGIPQPGIPGGLSLPTVPLPTAPTLPSLPVPTIPGLPPIPGGLPLPGRWPVPGGWPIPGGWPGPSLPGVPSLVPINQWKPERVILTVNGRVLADFPVPERLRRGTPSFTHRQNESLDPAEEFARNLRMSINSSTGHMGEVIAGFTTVAKKLGISGWEPRRLELATVTGILQHNPSYGTDDCVSLDLQVQTVDASGRHFDLDGQHGILHTRYIRVEYENFVPPIPQLGDRVRVTGRVLWDTDKEGFLEIHPRSHADIQVLH